MFKRKPEKIPYDKTNKKAVLNVVFVPENRLQDLRIYIPEIMLIRDVADLNEFMELYDVTAIVKEY